MRPAERRPEAAKQVYLSPYVHLFGFAQTFPPRPEFIRKLNFPFLQRNIPPKAYAVKGTQRVGGTLGGLNGPTLPDPGTAELLGVKTWTTLAHPPSHLFHKRGCHSLRSGALSFLQSQSRNSPISISCPLFPGRCASKWAMESWRSGT